MPLRCLKPDGESIQSFDLNERQWGDLAAENKAKRHLQMPCCSALVSMKKSKLGTPFFAHKVRGTCTTAPETEQHIQLKLLAVAVARENGWIAETEVAGIGPSGELWRANVLARKGKHTVAVEIQWSPQTPEETTRRQERYKEAGVRGLWLLRHPGFPVTKDLPAASIGGDLTTGLLALLPSHSNKTVRSSRWHQVLPMKDFFAAVFSRRFRFGLPPENEPTGSIKTGVLDCWHSACGQPTRIVTGIQFSDGMDDREFSVYTLGDVAPNLLAQALSYLPKDQGIGVIKERYSGTLGRKYMSNGCVHCDRIIGQFFEHDAWYNDEKVYPFEIEDKELWYDAINKGNREDWGEETESAEPMHLWNVDPAT